MYIIIITGIIEKMYGVQHVHNISKMYDIA